jgi:quinol-cytochrome oxidoreductase complex cytochrome b subunit/ferredoxin
MTDTQKNSLSYLINPAHYFGGITFLFLLIQVFTGIFLFMNFIPYVSEAYQSLVYINNVMPYGFFLRTLHRYSAFGMIIMCVLHMLRMYTTGRYLRPRDVGWVTGIVLLFITLLVTLTGFLSSFDGFSQLVLNGLADLFKIGRRDFQSLLSINYGLHLLFPILIFIFLITHFSRIARPKVFPSSSLSFIIIGLMVALSGLFPIASLPDSPDLGTGNFDPMRLFIGIGVVVILLVVLALIPYLTKQKRIFAYVDEARCTGCMYCSDVCPKKAITEKRISKNQQSFIVATVIKNKCQGCGICVGACRSSVIQLENHKDEILLEEVRKVWIEQTL